MFKKILVCLDGSSLAEQILPFVTKEAEHHSSRVLLLQVLGTPVPISVGAGPLGAAASAGPILVDQLQVGEDEARSYLRGVAGPLIEKGIETEYAVLRGNAGDTIVDYANKNQVDLIAMATHGRSGLKRALLGSTADFVLRKSGLPVLLIKPR